MSRLTMKQGRRLYSFIKRNCYDSEEMVERYVALEKNGNVTKETGIEVIGNIHKYEKGELLKGTMENILKLMGMPETLRLKDRDRATSNTEEKQHPSFAEYANEETKPEKKPEQQTEDSVLDEVLDSLEMVLNPSTLSRLRSAIESDKDRLKDLFEKDKQGYKDQIKQLVENIVELEQQIKDLENRPPKMPELTPMSEQYIKHPSFDRVACYVKGRINVLLTGGAGTGKSMMGREIAKALGMEYFEQSLGGRMQYAQIIGTTKLENGNSYFQPSPLVEALQKENTVVILNELFGLDPEVLIAFNDAFERGTRHIRTPGGKIEVKAAIIGTANTTGRSVSRQYTGAQRADDSLLSRFGAKLTIEIDPTVESTLLEQIENEEHRMQLAAKVNDLRTGIKSSNIAFDAGTRELVNCIENYAAHGNIEYAFEDSFLGGLSKAEKNKLGV